MRILYQSTMFFKKNYIVQPAQYLKKLAKIILKQNFFFKKRRRNQFWVKKKAKKNM